MFIKCKRVKMGVIDTLIRAMYDLKWHTTHCCIDRRDVFGVVCWMKVVVRCPSLPQDNLSIVTKRRTLCCSNVQLFLLFPCPTKKYTILQNAHQMRGKQGIALIETSIWCLGCLKSDTFFSICKQTLDCPNPNPNPGLFQITSDISCKIKSSPSNTYLIINILQMVTAIQWPSISLFCFGH